MIAKEIRKHLTTLKIHIDQIESWTMQATDLVYQIEEQLMDMEDKEYCQKYEMAVNISFLKEAAPKMYPPRLISNRCGQDHSAADGFYQSDFNLKKII